MQEKKTTDVLLTPGRKPVLELLQYNPDRIDTLFVAEEVSGLGEFIVLCREKNVRFRKVPKKDLDRLFQGTHQGVMARLRGRSLFDLDSLIERAQQDPFPLIIALDQVQDPGNVGTLARSLYALGGSGLIFPQDRTAFLGHTAAKAAAGALDHLPLCQVVNLARALDQCAEAGFTIYGTGMGEASTQLFSAELYLPGVLVLGNEDKGVRPNVLKRCTTILNIPMLRGFDSLNVAQAGAMIMGEILRQTTKKPI